MFSKTWIYISDSVVQDVVLETGTQSLISWLGHIIIMLNDLPSPSSVGHYVGFHFMEVCSWRHRLWFILYVRQVEEIDTCYLQVVVSFYQIEHPG